jgi:hypothetical protein
MLHTDSVIRNLQEKAKVRGIPLNDAQTAFVRSELAQVTPKVLEKKYPEYKGRSWVPLDSSVEKGAEYVVQRVFNRTGLARLIASSTTQLPDFGVVAEEVVRKVVEIGGVYQYTHRELEAAAFAGRSISAEKAMSARRGMEASLDELIMKGTLGGQPSGFTGLMNNPNVSNYSFNEALDSADPQDALQALHDWKNSINVQSKGVFSANTMILSNYFYHRLSTRQYSALVPKTILEIFEEQSKLTVEFSNYFDKGVSEDGYGTDLGVVYFKDPDTLSFANPVAYDELAPQEVDLSIKVPVRSTFGGVNFMQPLAASYGTFVRSDPEEL